MTQTEKEKARLVEPIERCSSFWADEDVYLKRLVDNLADYLLDNGVIVPPCKVGDTVYLVVQPCSWIHSKEG